VYDGRGAAPLPAFFDGTALLIFFRAESDPCRDMLRLRLGALRQFEPAIPVIGVSQETIEDTALLFQELEVSLPVVIDDRPYPASSVFALAEVPAFVLVHQDRIVWAGEGLGLASTELIAAMAEVAQSPAIAGQVLTGLSGSTPSRNVER
jgi:hypothetical protein